MKYLVIDDEFLARARLRELLLRIEPGAEIIEAENGQQAIELCEKHHPDYALVDIRMPGISGIELVYHLSALEHSPAVIFTTAYSEYALEAFDANAIDYLLKPVQIDRLKRALHKADPITKLQSDSLKETTRNMHISINQKGKIRLVAISSICYAKAENKYILVKTDKDEYLMNDTLNNLERELGGKFIRVHRNAVISIDHLKGLERNDDGQWCVFFHGIDDKVEISRRQTPVIRGWLKNRPLSD
jgi:two-component system response regulator AlgR